MSKVFKQHIDTLVSVHKHMFLLCFSKHHFESKSHVQHLNGSACSFSKCIFKYISFLKVNHMYNIQTALPVLCQRVSFNIFCFWTLLNFYHFINIALYFFKWSITAPTLNFLEENSKWGGPLEPPLGFTHLFIIQMNK